MTRNTLRIGLPSKGRLAEQAADLLAQAGLRFRRQDRTLFARVRDLPIEATFLRSDDIPVLCAEGAIDLGITGSDLVAEAGVDVITRLDLNAGQCRLAVCTAVDAGIGSVDQLPGTRVATSFPRITQQFFADRNAEVHLVPLSGSVEIMISLGVADAIVDLVQTGSTLAANNLQVIHEIGQYQTILIQNRQPQNSSVADRVVRRLEGVIIARAYTLLEYNVPRDRLAKAEDITPGFNSPTVSSLEDPAWCAIQVMVRRDSVIDVMDQLEAIGATAILETEIANCRL